ncbi:MAG: sugar nucleotide-binding protein [Acidimicrobiales bacterium]|nr:sugar nucleotide-binding protein [Acidimicrobiales bacterium]
MIARVLASNRAFDVVGSTRHGNNGAVAFDAGRNSIAEFLKSAECDWIVNAIGILDRRINEDDPNSVATAIDVNAKFPHRLAAAANRRRRVINIATDGVFSGRNAPYDERAPHDAPGVYARSKTLGEVSSPNVLNLRCSIIGPEQAPATSLLGWALSQPPGATITGYTNHRWNGVTTFHFAKMCAAVILAEQHDLPSPLHVVPGDVVSKAELLGLGLAAFGRSDVTVVAEPAPVPVDRTLGTLYPEFNRRLWAAAGHPHPPTIAEMMRELATIGR